VPCKCVAGRMNRKAESDALKVAIRKEGLSDTDANLAKKYGRNAHHIYMVREKLGIHKYRNDGFVRSSRKPRNLPRKCTPVKVSVPTGERFDLGGHVRDVLRFEMR